MTDDRRDDDEAAAWLLARERGTPGPSVPAATAERYQRLQALIEELPEMPRGAAPPGDWQTAVFAAIDAPGGAAAVGPPVAGAAVAGASGAWGSPAGTPGGGPIAPRLAEMPGGAALIRTKRIISIVRWAALAAIVPLVVLVAFFALRPPPPPNDPVAFATLDVEVLAGRDAHRSPDPSVGDQLVVRGMVHGAGELRVYDADGAMRARCAQPAANCLIERTAARSNLRLTIPLQAPGALRVVLFAAPLDGASGGLDADVAAAGRAGISVTTREPVQIR